MIIGYARVSTDDQKLESQIDALEGAGAERIYADKITGTRRSRPQLDQLIDQLRAGDVVVVTKYDRLARSLTRGKKLVVLVGQKRAVAIAVKNVSGHQRWSKLDEWLRTGLIFS